MPTLHVRSVPEDLYQRLHELAQEQSRSLSAQVVTLLNRALQEEERRRQQVNTLKAIRRRRFSPPSNLPDSTELLHEDRLR
jgi:plasmid stability protein